ncbi:MAG: hypothetical protein H0X30_38455 [Anaerolineae bacterium]|nr:hypothetical protein [Anaerolineae bacterium]
MSDGFYCEQQGTVMLYGFTHSDDDAVDAWAAALDAYLQSLPAGSTFRILMDVSDKAVSFTPRARQRTVELFTRYRSHHGRFAFLFSSRVAPYYSRIFFASLGRLTFELNYFTDRQKALEWLQL